MYHTKESRINNENYKELELYIIDFVRLISTEFTKLSIVDATVATTNFCFYFEYRRSFVSSCHIHHNYLLEWVNDIQINNNTNSLDDNVGEHQAGFQAVEMGLRLRSQVRNLIWGGEGHVLKEHISR